MCNWLSVVLDKSYLQAASREAFSNFASRYELFMTDTLFVEILTAAPNKRASCFSKLVGNEDAIMITCSVSSLLREEIETGQPAQHLRSHSLHSRYVFNRR